MSVFSGRLGLALVMAVLSGRSNGPRQAAPVRYWLPSWPIGFGSNLTVGRSSNTYSNFPRFDGGEGQGGGLFYTRDNFSTPKAAPWAGARTESEPSTISPCCNTKACSSVTTCKTRVGCHSRSMPVSTPLKFGAANGEPFAPFDTISSTMPSYSAHAGLEFRPTPDVSLSLGFGYTQQSGRVDSEINSPSLPGASPFAFMGAVDGRFPRRGPKPPGPA